MNNRAPKRNPHAAAVPENKSEKTSRTGAIEPVLIWFPILAALLSAVVYSPAVYGSFVFDDYHLPFLSPDAARMPARFWIGGVRPVLMATYWANYLYSGVNTFSYHAVNIALHVCAALLVFGIIRRLTELAELRLNAGLAAAFGAGLFLLHPLQTESVDYIAGRSEIVCAVFVLAGWLLFLRHFEARTSGLSAALILFCAAAALLSKESGVCLTALLLASDVYWKRETLAVQLRKRITLYLPIVIGSLGAAIYIVRGLSSANSAGFSVGGGPLTYALTQCRAVLLYLRLFFIPAGQNADWQLPLYRSVLDGGAWLYLVGMLALLAATAWLYTRARAVSFGLVVFLLTLAPTSSFVPIKDAMAERRVYIAIVGLAFAGISAVARYVPGSRLLAPAAALILLMLGAASWSRSEVWSSDTALWQDCVDKNPRNARARAGLGSAFMFHQNYEAAVREFKAVIQMEGLNATSGQNLGAAYEFTGRNDLALATYRQLVKTTPTAEAFTRIGYLEGMKENLPASLAALNEAIRLDPYHRATYSFRGVAKLAMNDIPGAKEDFRHALVIDAADQVAATWMAKLH